MLNNKELGDLICPIDQRKHDVQDFLTSVDSTLQFSTPTLYDIYGPTIFEPNISCCVVTKETTKGGEKINEERIKRGLQPLQLYIVDYVSDLEETDNPGIEKVNNSSPALNHNHNGNNETLQVKLSSTHLRKLSLGTYVEKHPNCFSKGRAIRLPFSISSSLYIIGLTGGICSGKSRFAHLFASSFFSTSATDTPKKLGELKFNHPPRIIDCDALCHAIYEEGSVYDSHIVAELTRKFGIGILSELGHGKIDRKKLAGLVFGNE
ncbi:unnamed protein product, partial [Gordionus sp. m RMFG-2023]